MNNNSKKVSFVRLLEIWLLMILSNIILIVIIMLFVGIIDLKR